MIHRSARRIQARPDGDVREAPLHSDPYGAHTARTHKRIDRPKSHEYVLRGVEGIQGFLKIMVISAVLRVS